MNSKKIKYVIDPPTRNIKLFLLQEIFLEVTDAYTEKALHFFNSVVSNFIKLKCPRPSSSWVRDKRQILRQLSDA